MSRRISSFSMNLYSTRKRDGGIVPTVQLGMIFATQRTSIAAVHGAYALPRRSTVCCHVQESKKVTLNADFLNWLRTGLLPAFTA
jgi:hypothetical protein